jgi:ABC-type glycerol-3-phosphate transport system substrate-binding protein
MWGVAGGLAVGLGPAAGNQKCADEFHRQHPDLSVKITQYGWNDYWSKITAGFIADTAPDVFTDHLSKFAQYADLGVLRPLDQLGPIRDVQDSDYQAGLAELWKGQGRAPVRHAQGLGHHRDLLQRRRCAGAAGITKQQRRGSVPAVS